MKRRGFIQMLSGLAALAPMVSKAKPEVVEPKEPDVRCPVCGADQTDKEWYAGEANAEGKAPAVCWGCRAREVKPQYKMGGIGQYVATEPDDDRDLCDIIYDISPVETPFCNRRDKRDRRL